MCSKKCGKTAGVSGLLVAEMAGGVSVCGEGFCRPLRRLVRRSSKGGG